MTPTEIPQLLVLGHVTRDEIGGQIRLGGAVSYAAQAAVRLGIETALVTVSPPDDPLLEPLRRLPGLGLHCGPSAGMTTFALAYPDGRRTLVLRRRAEALRAADIPAAWRQAPIAYVGPVVGECDRALVASLQARFIGAGLQGWLRQAATDGQIAPALLPEALNPPRLQLAVVSEEDHPDVDRLAARFAATGAIVAITRGAWGATLIGPAGRLGVPAAPAHEIDPTGAGDVFGVVLMLRLAAGASLVEAGTSAAQNRGACDRGSGPGTPGVRSAGRA